MNNKNALLGESICFFEEFKQEILDTVPPIEICQFPWFEVFRYEILELAYEQLFSARFHSAFPSTNLSHKKLGLWIRFQNIMGFTQWNSNLFLGMFSAWFPFIFETLTFSRWKIASLIRRTSLPNRNKGTTLALGFLNRGGYAQLVLPYLSANENKKNFVMVHDDVLGRHQKIIKKSRLSEKSLIILNPMSYVKVGEFFKILSETRKTYSRLKHLEQQLPMPYQLTLNKLLEKLIFKDRILRISIHFLAVKKAMMEYCPDKIVLPDERLPLARAIALYSQKNQNKKRKLVSIPEITDQISRRVPLLDQQLCDSLLLYNKDCLEFMRENCKFLNADTFPLTIENNTLGRETKNSPNIQILFVSQGLSYNKELITGLEEVISRLNKLSEFSKKIILKLRPHPGESYLLFNLKYILTTKDILVSQPKDTLDCDISESSIVIGCSSVALLKPIRDSKPVVIWSLKEPPRLLPFLGKKNVYFPTEKDMLYLHLKQIIGELNCQE